MNISGFTVSAYNIARRVSWPFYVRRYMSCMPLLVCNALGSFVYFLIGNLSFTLRQRLFFVI